MIALGCMRLSTEPVRDDEQSVAVLHAALDAGVTVFDTADSYCWTNEDLGHNERLLARAIGRWSGDRSRLSVATKGGITRPEGRWEPDGRAKHLGAACERREGFSHIEQVAFTRVANPAHVNRAVIAWCDDPSQLEPLAPALRERQDGGWTICVLSWQPGIEDGTRTDVEVRAAFAAVGGRAGLRFDLDICPHGAGPPRCWCRKPLPGLGVALIHRHALDPAQCLFVGNGPQDAGFARKLGFRHVPTLAPSHLEPR